MDQYMILKEYVASSSAETAVFYAIAILAIALSVGVISDRNVIRSGFLLIGVFGAISGLFLLLQAQFLALAQVMIYAVGITLVVVIALMLTNPKSEKDSSYEEIAPANQDGSMLGQLLRAKGALPALVGALSFFTIYVAIRSESWVSTQEPVAADNVRVLGEALTTKYSLPFEFASVLLLAALIGAIMLAKADPKVTPNDSPVEE
ncbi:NADH-quinone oxidoreductase subunit J [Candidatus Obscuribacterales bacterium]|nr:NADH-quinone oxidoreductase subunit J [Candidatus Obscuribacterales bacterium]MBX3150547.1 NADH-quinone oxidoreductase subunit J [Candidatus Obscuribacterales bacterium]